MPDICTFPEDCTYRNRCHCRGRQDQLCALIDRIGGLVLVEKELHPLCAAKTCFGDVRLCLCPARLPAPR